ncbi:GntR family transcriptional regulator [Jiangella endophytica]|uniref:GntR family transcriptional regulator n=1 Tax=Jiangella endophytica TaxID=1623398 RepID=UPI000E353A63|nr:GntR family transcriptional regulator [Jiangella endophytica]
MSEQVPGGADAGAVHGQDKSLTQGELALVHVRDRIMTGVYKSGTRLSEQAIADELQLSRTPVREALRRLSETGLIELKPNQRATVMGWSVDLLRDTFDTRILLESEGAKHAASLISDAELFGLAELMAAMEEAFARGGPDSGDTVAGLNQRFHAAIMQASGRDQVIRLTANLRFQPRMVIGDAGLAEEFRRRANHHHQEIHRALSAHDPEWAEAAMRSHLLAARHAAICSHELEGP